MVQVALSDANTFAIDQKSQITSCYFQNCRTGLSEAVRASIPAMKKFANAIGEMGDRAKKMIAITSAEAAR